MANRILPGFPYQIMGSTQKITVGAASVTSTAFGASTYMLRVVSTTAAHYRVTRAGSAATAAGDAYLPAATIEYIGVKPGDKLSIIEDSAGGTAYLTECTF